MSLSAAIPPRVVKLYVVSRGLSATTSWSVGSNEETPHRFQDVAVAPDLLGLFVVDDGRGYAVQQPVPDGCLAGRQRRFISAHTAHWRQTAQHTRVITDVTAH